MTLNRNIEQITVLQGRNDIWIIFKDLLSYQADLSGRTYRNPTYSSWKRLLKVLNNPELVQLELEDDGYSAIIIGWKITRYP